MFPGRKKREAPSRAKLLVLQGSQHTPNPMLSSVISHANWAERTHNLKRAFAGCLCLVLVGLVGIAALEIDDWVEPNSEVPSGEVPDGEVSIKKKVATVATGLGGFTIALVAVLAKLRCFAVLNCCITISQCLSLRRMKSLIVRQEKATGQLEVVAGRVEGAAGRLAVVVDQADTVTARLERGAGRVEGTVDSLQVVVDQADAATARLEHGADRVGGTVESLQYVVDQAGATTARLENVASELNSASGELSSVSKDVWAFAETVFNNHVAMQSSVVDVQSMVARIDSNVKVLTESIKEERKQNKTTEAEMKGQLSKLQTDIQSLERALSKDARAEGLFKLLRTNVALAVCEAKAQEGQSSTDIEAGAVSEHTLLRSMLVSFQTHAGETADANEMLTKNNKQLTANNDLLTFNLTKLSSLIGELREGLNITDIITTARLLLNSLTLFKNDVTTTNLEILTRVGGLIASLEQLIENAERGEATLGEASGSVGTQLEYLPSSALPILSSTHTNSSVGVSASHP